MDHLSCNVVQDLLVLYDDNVCSEESARLIQEHIEACQTCRAIYENTKKELPEPTSFDADVAKLKKALGRLNFRRSILYGAILVFLLFVFVIGYRYFDEHITPIPTEYIEVTELYQLKNGDIYFTLESDKDITMTAASPLMVPTEKRLENSDDGWYEIRLDHSFWRSKSKQHSKSFIYPLEVYQEWDNKTIVHESRAIYCIGKDVDDKLTIWKDGQDILAAPNSIEKKVAQEKQHTNYSYDNFDYPIILD